MPTKYCEFQPSEHRNKRPATLLFYDDEADKHPLAVCEICANKLRKLYANPLLKPLREKAVKAPKAPGAKPADAASIVPSPSKPESPPGP
ncbi:MAG: hypothetical protein ACYDCK_14865 [Thermoplasmatota archaeon]